MIIARSKTSILMACFVLSVMSSCVNEGYDLKELDTTVTVGGENLTIPVGETQKMTIKELLSSADQDMVHSLPDGSYSIRLNDNMNLSDQIPDLSTSLVVDDINFMQSMEYTVGDLSAEKVLFAGEKVSNEFTFGEGDILKNVKIDPVSTNVSKATGVWEYVSKINTLDLGLTPVGFNVAQKVNLPSIPHADLLPDNEVVEIPEAIAIALPSKVSDVTVSATLAEGINSISEVRFDQNSRIKISMDVDAPFIKSGELNPAIQLDLSKILKMKEGSAVIDLGQDFKLDKTNTYAATKEYYLSSMLLNDSDWQNGSLNLKKEVTLNGNLTLKNLTTDGATIKAKAADLTVNVKVDFLDVKLGSATVDLKPLQVEQTSNVDINVDDIALVEGVKNIKSVSFDEQSLLSIQTSLTQLERAQSLKMNLDELKLQFPEGFQVEGAVNGEYVISNKDLKAGVKENIHLLGINFPASTQNGVFSYDGQVKVHALMTISGKVNTADLPSTAAEDAAFNCQVDASMNIKDGEVSCNQIDEAIPATDKEISLELPKDFESFGNFTVYPAATTQAITFDIQLPKSDIAIVASPLKIDFPDFIVFGNVGSYEYDAAENSITINGPIPDRITLPIEKFVIVPQKSEGENGGMFVKDTMSVSGQVSVRGGDYKVSQFDELLAGKASIALNIPEIIAETVEVDQFNFDLEKSVDFTILPADKIPAELLEVKTALLNNVKAEFNIGVSNLPDFGAGVHPVLDLNLTLPEEIILENDSRVKDNVLSVKAILNNGKINIAPLRIKGLDFSNFDFAAGKDLTAHIDIKGGLKVANPTIDINDLSGKVIKTDAGIDIRDIRFSKIVGKADYKIDPVKQSIKLDQLPDFMKDENFVLDFTKPYLKINAITNVGIPILGNLKLVPIYKGIADESRQVVLENIKFPYTSDATKPAELHFYISGKEEGCPADYTWLQADLNSLIKKIPDNLEVVFEAGTNVEEDCLIEPEQKYELKLDYEFIVPLEFGPELNMAVSDTITNLPPIVSEILESGTLQLQGAVTSSLPVQLDMDIQLISKDKKIIPLEKPASQVIKACKSDGSETVSPLDLTLVAKKGADLSNLDGFKLNFTVTSGNVSGIPVTEKSFVQALLKLRVPGGVTIDLQNLPSNETNKK